MINVFKIKTSKREIQTVANLKMMYAHNVQKDFSSMRSEFVLNITLYVLQLVLKMENVFHVSKDIK